MCSFNRNVLGAVSRFLMSPSQSLNAGDTDHEVPLSRPAAGPKMRPPPMSISMVAEDDRLRTFLNWPSKAVTPSELAANGFYYPGESDIARCAFCGLEVSQWVEGDSVCEDHKKYSPDCDFVRGRPCGNIMSGCASASSTSPASSRSSSPPSYDVCGPFSHFLRPNSGPERSILPSLLEDLEHLGVSRTTGPIKPRYSSLEARLDTYKNWPEACPLKPAALAEAGFYSTNIEDHAVCFHCGGGLKDWVEGDDPWVEHARWFNKCAFVSMHKGRDFVSSVLQNKPIFAPYEELRDLQPAEGMTSGSSEESVNELQAAAPMQPSSANAGSEESKYLGDMELCKICYTNERSIVFLPCGHFVSCAMCASALSSCPVCRKTYEATVRAYLS